MKFKWWGHACFAITGSAGKVFVTDPYGEDFPYKKVTDRADIVTISHDHFDHNDSSNVSGSPEVITTPGDHRISGIKITGLESHHDQSQGTERGSNIIYTFELEGWKIAHLGDLGHTLNSEQQKKLSGTDVLLIPVGGHFTIDAHQAEKIVNFLKPAVVFPMHYKTELIDLPIEGVNPFLEKFPGDSIVKVGDSELSISELPSARKIYVLDYV